MDMISEMALRFHRFLLIAMLLLFAACNQTPTKEKTILSFYHPNKTLSGYKVPIIVTAYNNEVLENKVSFSFEKKEYSLPFRFRLAYFEDNIPSIPSMSEVNIISTKHVIDTLVLEKNKIYQLNSALFIDSTAMLRIEEGVQLYIEDAVDIISSGSIEVLGNADNPVLINALKHNWGGIQSDGGNINMEHVIITHSGGNDSIKVRHSYSQPSIYMINNGFFKANNLTIINCLGKAMYIKGSIVSIKKSLFADCDTGPEINWSKVELDSIICMNIPDAKNGEDDDNDALYIYGRHKDYPKDQPLISNVMLGFAKDDGFDHGKNSMQVKNLLVYNVKDKAISLEGGRMGLKNVFLSDARVLIGVKQDTHAVIDSIYLGKGQKTDILENMQQDPTLEITNQMELDDLNACAEKFWFSIY